jgi:hypothetical protein
MEVSCIQLKLIKYCGCARSECIISKVVQLHSLENYAHKNYGGVRSTARHAIHSQFNIRANALEIRAAQSPKCIVRRAVDT